MFTVIAKMWFSVCFATQYHLFSRLTSRFLQLISSRANLSHPHCHVYRVAILIMLNDSKWRKQTKSEKHVYTFSFCLYPCICDVSVDDPFHWSINSFEHIISPEHFCVHLPVPSSCFLIFSPLWLFHYGSFLVQTSLGLCCTWTLVKYSKWGKF